MDLRIKFMIREHLPVAVLCDCDSPLTYWNEPGDARVDLDFRDRWNPKLPGIHGGQYEPIVKRSAVDSAIAQIEGVVGRKLPHVVCASMIGRVIPD